MDSRQISLERANELKSYTKEYTQFKNDIQTQELFDHKAFLEQKAKILAFYNANSEDWDDYKWQLQHRIQDANTLSKLLPLTDVELNAIRRIEKLNRFSISPYYLALIGISQDDPLKLQSIPNYLELKDHDGLLDPMKEEFSNPATRITRRYPDRLIINVTNSCAMLCRHCQRKRNFKNKEVHITKKEVNEAIQYIKKNPEIRDVLLTGGDALLLSDTMLEYILKQLRAIDSVEIIRIGTRTPVTLPQRITKKLVNMLKKYKPLYLNTQFNHPKEITTTSIQSLQLLNDSGIILGNQTVLLKGINDHKFTMMYLNQKLLKHYVKPYYIFHPKHVLGTKHFYTSIQSGLEIMEYLRGNTSGLSIPTYILNAEGGLGKVPLLPQYILDFKDNVYTIKTWEGKTIQYKD